MKSSSPTMGTGQGQQRPLKTEFFDPSDPSTYASGHPGPSDPLDDAMMNYINQLPNGNGDNLRLAGPSMSSVASPSGSSNASSPSATSAAAAAAAAAASASLSNSNLFAPGARMPAANGVHAVQQMMAFPPPRLSDFGMIPAPGFSATGIPPRSGSGLGVGVGAGGSSSMTAASSPSSTAASSPPVSRRIGYTSSQAGSDQHQHQHQHRRHPSSSLSPPPVFSLEGVGAGAGVAGPSAPATSISSHSKRSATSQPRSLLESTREEDGISHLIRKRKPRPPKALTTETPQLSTEDELHDFGSFQTIHPPLDQIRGGFRILVNGIKRKGAKSRVETQIKMSIAIVQPTDPNPPPTVAEDDTRTDYVKIGSYRAVRLPNSIGAKKKGRKLLIVPDTQQGQAEGIRESEVLRLTTEVHCMDTGNKASACAKCVSREGKRAANRLANRIRPPASDSDDGTYQKKPESMEVDDEGLTQADRDKIVLFNCATVVPIVEGKADVPARVTCYCRHHREKTGYRITFKLWNAKGDLIAVGAAPPVMITDDHKTTMASSAKSNATASDAAPTTAPSVASSAHSRKSKKSRDGNSEKKAKKSKPYDRQTTPHPMSSGQAPSDAISSVSGAASPRSTVSHGLSMTPLEGPSIPGSPLSNFGQTAGSYFQSMPAHSGALTPSLIASAGNMSLGNPHEMDSSVQAVQQRLSAWAQQQPQHHGSALGLDSQEPDFEAMLNLSPPASEPPLFDASPSDLAQLQQLLGQDVGEDWTQQQDTWMAPQQPAPLRPVIHRLVPADGPTHGGIEVTILGENFSPTMVCSFGDYPSVTVQSYGPTTLVCLLPASPVSGPVPVTIRDTANASLPPQGGLLFTYNDVSDQKLMEMALTAVGLRVTGKVVGAVEIARRIMSAPQSSDPSRPSADQVPGQQRSEISQAFQRFASESDAQAAIIRFLRGFLFDKSAKLSRSARLALNHVSPEGQSMLHLSSLLGYDQLAKLLIEADANPNIHDRNGYTALAFAALSGNMSCIRLLLSARARPAILTFSNQTPAELARRAGHTGVARLLERKPQQKSRYRRSSNGSSADADNPTSDDTDSLESCLEQVEGALSPRKLTTPADILASRTAPSDSVKSDETMTETVTLHRKSPTELPPPYTSSDAAGWLQRTLSHLPGSQVSAQLKEYIPEAVWDKIESAQLLIPHMPDLAAQAGEMLDTSSWTQQAWLAVPISAWLPKDETQDRQRSKRTVVKRRLKKGKAADQPSEPLTQIDKRLKADKMLFLFWLPVLLLAFAYTAVTTIPFALVRAILGPVTRVIKP